MTVRVVTITHEKIFGLDVINRKMMNQRFKKWFLLIFLLCILFLFFVFHLNQYINFESLKTHHAELIRWTSEHSFLAVSVYILIYIIGVAVSIPGASFFTLVGGFLFGIWFGTLYAVIAATIGSTILFLAVRMALAEWVLKKSGRLLKQMEKGFKEDAFYYLVILRLVPIFPFWLVNVVPALVDVKLITFVTATGLGIIPGAFIYASLGNGLGKLFDANQSPNLNVITQPAIFLPLLGLAVLSLLPIIYKRFKVRKRKK